jgi:hypothetical protein
MISRSFLLHKIGSDYAGKKKMLVADQSTGDIIQGILDTHEKYQDQYDKISSYFKGYSNEQTARNIFDFLKRNIRYVIENEDQQLLRSAAAILYQAQSDCKCYSLFVAGICRSLNIPFCFRFASYRYGQKNPQHVFVVINPDTKNEIWCDPVLSYFNYKKPYQYKLDKKPRKMAVYSISGIGATKKKGSLIKRAAKGYVTVLKKGVKGVIKVAAAPARNAFLEMVKLNIAGLGTKTWKAYQKAPAKLKNFWESIGGRIASLVKNAEKGHKKKRIFGTYEAAIGFDPATLAATAAPILASFAKFLKSIGIEPKELVAVAKEAVNKKAQQLISNQVEKVEQVQEKYQQEANQIFE